MADLEGTLDRLSHAVEGLVAREEAVPAFAMGQPGTPQPEAVPGWQRRQDEAREELARLIPAVNRLTVEIDEANAAQQHAVRGAPLWDVQSLQLRMQQRAQELRQQLATAGPPQEAQPAFAMGPAGQPPAQQHQPAQQQDLADQARRAALAQEVARAQARVEQAKEEMFRREEAARLRAEHQRRPEVMVATQQQQATAQAQQQAQMLQARAAYLRTPEGAQQFRQQQQAQAQAQTAQVQVQRAQDIAQQGQVSVGLRDFGRGLASLNPYVAAAQAVFSKMTQTVALASPNTMATFSGSMDLVSAKIGGLFIPVIDAASNALQMFAKAITPVIDWLRDRSQSLHQALGGQGPQREPRTRMERLHVALGGELEGAGAAAPDMKRSLKGLPSAGIGTGESVYERTMMAGLTVGVETIEVELLREQLKNMIAQGILLERIADSRGIQGQPSSFGSESTVKW